MLRTINENVLIFGETDGADVNHTETIPIIWDKFIFVIDTKLPTANFSKLMVYLYINKLYNI